MDTLHWADIARRVRERATMHSSQELREDIEALMSELLEVEKENAALIEEVERTYDKGYADGEKAAEEDGDAVYEAGYIDGYEDGTGERKAN